MSTAIAAAPSQTVGVGTFLPRIVVLASGDGSNLQALIDACANNDLQAAVVGVISDVESSGALLRARAVGIMASHCPIRGGIDSAPRLHQEEELLLKLRSMMPDLVVLAGWMRVFSPGFLLQIACPVINLHPALLPASPEEDLGIPILRGAHAVDDALRLGLPHTGVTIHHVTPEVDAGPVILRQQVNILPGDTPPVLHHRLRQFEHRLLVQAVESILSNHQPTP